MSKGIFRKIGNCLVPLDNDAKKVVSSIDANEDGAYLTATKCRNIKLHKKFFAALNLAFSVWEPPEYTIDKDTNDIHITPATDFDSFRVDIICLAGHCEQVYSLDGKTFKLRAKSISFAKCEEADFQELYKKMLDVIWKYVLKDLEYKNPQEVERIALELLRFD